MSFILDALKKSEAERQRRAGPALLGMRLPNPRRHIPVWVWVAGAALLLINGVVVLWLLLKPAADTGVKAPAVSAPAVAAVPTNAAPASTAPVAAAPVAATAVPAAPGNAATLAAEEALAEEANEADRRPAVADEHTAPASRLPHYADLANELPALRLDFHVYSPNLRERYAFINMHKVREGEITAEGMHVVAITRDGVELHYKDHEFLLSRD
jgi:general secretion pathway protein B